MGKPLEPRGAAIWAIGLIEPREDGEALAKEVSQHFSRPLVGGALEGEVDGVPVQYWIVRHAVRNAKTQSSFDRTSTVVVIDLPVPAVNVGRIDATLRGESEGKAMLRGLAGAFMPQSMVPVSFEEDPEFQSRFNVSGPDHGAIRQFFGPEARAAKKAAFRSQDLPHPDSLQWPARIPARPTPTQSAHRAILPASDWRPVAVPQTGKASPTRVDSLPQPRHSHAG